jgi:hypothetical protein
MPYKSHPLYKLRLATLITAIIGFLLNLLAISTLAFDDSYLIPPFIVSLFFLFVSFLVVLHDLITYAIAKASITATRQTHFARQHSSHPQFSTPHPSRQTTPTRSNNNTNEDIKWPSKRLITTDIILAIIFQWLFWLLFFYIIASYHHRYYSNGAEMFEAYGNLPNLVASLLHAVAAWKEIMARKKQGWRREYERDVGGRVCGNCGGVESEGERVGREGDGDAPINFMDEPEGAAFSGDRHDSSGAGDEAGPSILKRFGKGKVVLPRWARGPEAGERDVEHKAADTGDDVIAPLLVTPDDSSSTEVAGPSGYGTLSQSVESLNRAAETMVKKKDKGKKRVVDVESV